MKKTEKYLMLVVLLLVGVSFRASSAPVELTEDLIVTNAYTAGTEWNYQTVTFKTSSGGGTRTKTDGEYAVIQKANYAQIRPLWVRDLRVSSGSCGIAHFYHRTVTVKEDQQYVEYQVQSLSGANIRYCFMRFEQAGDDVHVWVPVRNYKPATTEGNLQAENLTLGYSFSRTPASALSAFTFEDLAYRIEETNPNGEIVQSADLSLGYSGDYGVTIIRRTPEEREVLHTVTGELAPTNVTAYWTIPNALYHEIEPVSAEGNAAVGEGVIKFYHWRDYGLYAEVQAQVEADGKLKWFFLYFEQDGANVRVSVNGSRAATLSATVKYGYDALMKYRYCAGANALGNAALTSFTYRHRRPRALEDEAYWFSDEDKETCELNAATLGGTNTYTGVTVIDNSCVTLAAGPDVLPAQEAGTTKGIVVVTNSATLVLPQNTQNKGPGGADGVNIRASTKSVVKTQGSWAFSDKTKFELDDATLEILPKQTNSPSGNFKLNFLTLANGALLTGGPHFYCGNSSYTSVWRSIGDESKTNVVDGRIRVGDADYKLTLEVDAPLHLKGGLSSNRTNASGAEVTKTGGSVLLLSRDEYYSTYGFMGNYLLVNEGTVRCCASDCFALGGTKLSTYYQVGSSDTPATLSFAAGTTNKAVQVQRGAKSGVIELEADAAFIVQKVDTSWDTADTLTVKYGDLNTSALIIQQTLTAQQRARIRLERPDGEICKVVQDPETGRLNPVPGLVLIFR